MKKNRLRQIIVVSLLLVIALPVMTLLGTSSPANPGADVTQAEKLIEKAKHQFGLVNDYPAALKFIDAAILEAETPAIKAEALINKAYIFFLMRKKITAYKPLMDEALLNNPDLKTDALYYHKTFVGMFSLLKSKPVDFLAQVQLKTTEVKEYKHPKRKKFFVKVGASSAISLDQRFRDIYSFGHILPRFGLGYMPGKLVYIWADFKFFTASSMIPDTDITTTTTQRFLSGGIGFFGHISKKLDFKVELGLVNHAYKEEAMDITVSGSLGGYNLDSALLYSIGRFFYIEASIGIRSGKKGGFLPGQLKSDGLHTGLCLEYRF